VNNKNSSAGDQERKRADGKHQGENNETVFMRSSRGEDKRQG